jgi:hypothetical protein
MADGDKDRPQADLMPWQVLHPEEARHSVTLVRLRPVAALLRHSLSIMVLAIRPANFEKNWNRYTNKRRWFLHRLPTRQRQLPNQVRRITTAQDRTGLRSHLRGKTLLSEASQPSSRFCYAMPVGMQSSWNKNPCREG